MVTLIFFHFILVTICRAQSYDVIIQGEWGYNVINGPATWGYNYPFCNLDSQSPIEITTRAVEVDATSGNIVMKNYDTLKNASLINNGHTISFQFHESSENQPEITGGHLKSEIYVYEQSHWHWASSNERGSEHHIDGKKDAMELHMVHRNLKYKNMSEAFLHDDGLAVLALFYEISDTDNENLTEIIAALKELNSSPFIQGNKENNKAVNISQPLSVGMLFPEDVFSKDVFYYKGSLTTPNCYESVMWTIFTAKLSISVAQLEVFRNVKTLNGNSMSNNIRPEQEVGERIVHRIISSNANSFNISLLSGTLVISINLVRYFVGFI